MRINVTKRAICAVVALIMAMSAFSVFAAAQTVEPCFNNVERVSNHAKVSSSGKLTATNISVCSSQFARRRYFSMV